jgi:ATP-dependent Clp protease adapter protein ClpS
MFSADRPFSRPSGDTSRQLPRYRLILLRNAGADLMYIIRCVMELARFPREEATHKMWEAHHSGRSVILVTWLEKAELYAELLAEKGLATSIEKDER